MGYRCVRACVRACVCERACIVKWLEHHPVNQKVAGLMPGDATLVFVAVFLNKKFFFYSQSTQLLN